MIAGNISYTHGAAIELQCSAAMMAVLMMSRHWSGRVESGTSASFQGDAYGLSRLTLHSRHLIRMMLLAFMGCTLPCGAVTLGDATLLSGPAQPLRVEIELASELQPGLQVRLASEQAFRENGLSYPAWLGRAQVSLLPVQGSRRRAALLLTAPQTVQAPLVELMLEFSWSTGSTQQLYVLLLDASTRPKDAKVMAEAPAAVVAGAPADTVGLVTNGAEPALDADPAKAVVARGMTFEMALRFPFKNREHAGVVSARRSTPPPTGPAQDRLRLAQAETAEAERIAQERREADHKARRQELERNARQMRELAAEAAAAAAPPAGASFAPPALLPASTPSIPATVPLPVPKIASTPQKQPAPAAAHASGWLWVLGFTAPVLLTVWSLRFWFSRRRRPEFSDSGGAARSVFELSPAETEQAYTDYLQQRPAPVQADGLQVEDARAFFTLNHFAEAQQLLEKILQQNPRSHEAWFLQARVLCAQGDRAGYAQRMPFLRELTHETGELWDRVLALGQELDPDNPLYQPQPSATAQPLPQARPAMPETPQVPAMPKPPVPVSTTASSAVDDALRMATAYGARPV